MLEYESLEVTSFICLDCYINFSMALMLNIRWEMLQMLFTPRVLRPLPSISGWHHCSHIRGHVQTISGNHSVIVRLGGRGACKEMTFIFALSAHFNMFVGGQVLACLAPPCAAVPVERS